MKIGDKVGVKGEPLNKIWTVACILSADTLGLERQTDSGVTVRCTVGFLDIVPIGGFQIPTSGIYKRVSQNSLGNQTVEFSAYDTETQKKIIEWLPLLKPSHGGHEIVNNTVLNKTFKYCRTCKVEV